MAKQAAKQAANVKYRYIIDLAHRMTEGQLFKLYYYYYYYYY